MTYKKYILGLIKRDMGIEENETGVVPTVLPSPSRLLSSTEEPANKKAKKTPKKKTFLNGKVGIVLVGGGNISYFVFRRGEGGAQGNHFQLHMSLPITHKYA